MNLTAEHAAGRTAALRAVDAWIAKNITGYTDVWQKSKTDGDSWRGMPPYGCDTGMEIPYYTSFEPHTTRITDHIANQESDKIRFDFVMYLKSPEVTEEDFSLYICHAAVLTYGGEWPEGLGDLA